MVGTPKRLFPVEVEPKGPFPLLVGLSGPPGGGKTFSALKLAHGIQKVRGGPIVVIDTEAGRSRMYHDQIPFHLVTFEPPFRPSDFLEAVLQVLLTKPSAVIVDCLSDEHEGTGGVLDWHEEEIDRRLGKDKDDWKRREAMGQSAWVLPKMDRVRMMNGFLRITTPLIFTFRARDKTRPIKDSSGKTVPTKVGYQAIAPAEVVHGMTLMCLLPPNANGVPVWRSNMAGEDFLLKWPNFLQKITGTGQIDESIGERLAVWAAGGGTGIRTPHPVESGSNTPASPPKTEGGGSESPPPSTVSVGKEEGYELAVVPIPTVDETERLADIEHDLRLAAECGYKTLAQRWNHLAPEDRDIFVGVRDREMIPRARECDAIWAAKAKAN